MTHTCDAVGFTHAHRYFLGTSNAGFDGCRGEDIEVEEFDAARRPFRRSMLRHYDFSLRQAHVRACWCVVESPLLPMLTILTVSPSTYPVLVLTMPSQVQTMHARFDRPQLREARRRRPWPLPLRSVTRVVMHPAAFSKVPRARAA